MIFKRLSFWIALVGIVSIFFLVKKLQYQPPAPPPLAEPTRSPYKSAVAATGIIEASRENVKISTIRAGMIAKIFVQVGSVVKKGDPLLQLDDRTAQAQLKLIESQLTTLHAALDVEKVQKADWTDQWERASKLEKEKVATEEDRLRKQFAVAGSEARLKKIEADIANMEAQIQLAKTELDLLTTRALRDGTILQVNVREGEYANLMSNSDPLMILGDVNQLQIRADVDEQDAPKVVANQAAVAYLKGDTKNSIPLKFVRIEPFVVPKRSLTGDSAERVDTRVLQIIFAMDRPAVAIYVGQQVDVYIERPTADAEKKVAQK